jgi:beta-mannanase
VRRSAILAPVAALVLAILASTTVAARSPVALGISSERSTDVAAINDYKATTGAKPALWTLWSDWGDRGGNATCIKGIGTCAFPSETARALTKRGVTPFIWWQPVDPANPSATTYTKYQNIIKGKHDAYIRDWAKAAKALGKPVVVRFAHEMNGKWFPWSIGKHGNTNKGFRDAWQHVVKEVRAVGARNVKFLWSPYNTNRRLAPFYPGNEYVDYVGITSLNWGNERWRTLAGLLESPMTMLRNVTRSRSAPQGKPVILPEVGSNHLGGDKAGWIRDGYAHAYKRYPTVRAMVYLDYDTSVITAGQPDWRLIMPADGSALAAYRSVASKPVFRASFP